MCNVQKTQNAFSKGKNSKDTYILRHNEKIEFVFSSIFFCILCCLFFHSSFGGGGMGILLSHDCREKF